MKFTNSFQNSVHCSVIYKLFKGLCLTPLYVIIYSSSAANKNNFCKEQSILLFTMLATAGKFLLCFFKKN